MLTILGITAPIFLLIGTGFVSVRAGLVKPRETRGLGTFVINIALPALRTAMILNAGMPMLSIHPILARPYGQEGLCAAALVAATAASFLTISVLLWFTGAG